MTRVHMEHLSDCRTLLDAFRLVPRHIVFVRHWNFDGEEAIETLTFGQFLSQAERIAAYYLRQGVGPNDTIILILPQSTLQMSAFIGAMLIGAIPAILAYPNFKADKAKYQHGLFGVIANLSASLLVVDPDFPSELLEGIARQKAISVVRDLSAASSSEMGIQEWNRSSADDVAFLQHSAGTTGLQKGVALRHSAVLNQLRHLSLVLALREDDKIVTWLPLYHDMGLITCFIMPLACHLEVTMESPTDWILQPATFLRLATSFRSTLCWLPNFAFQFMARRTREEDLADLDLSFMRAMVNCSEPVRLQSMEEFYQRFQKVGLRWLALHSSYAMAENTFAVTQSRIAGTRGPQSMLIHKTAFREERQVRVCGDDVSDAMSVVSSGEPLPSNLVRILDEKGIELPEGGVGQISITSDSLFDGYYNRPDLTEKVKRQHWYSTGDVGFMQAGELYVVGRRDDVIIVAGKNIDPNDVEEAVFAHPAIHDGRAVAFALFNESIGTQDLIVVAEVSDPVDLDNMDIVSELHQSVLHEVGVSPRAVQLVPPKWMVKSTAGKPARSTNRTKFLNENPGFSKAAASGVPRKDV